MEQARQRTACFTHLHGTLSPVVVIPYMYTVSGEQDRERVSLNGLTGRNWQIVKCRSDATSSRCL